MNKAGDNTTQQHHQSHPKSRLSSIYRQQRWRDNIDELKKNGMMRKSVRPSVPSTLLLLVSVVVAVASSLSPRSYSDACHRNLERASLVALSLTSAANHRRRRRRTKSLLSSSSSSSSRRGHNRHDTEFDVVVSSSGGIIIPRGGGGDENEGDGVDDEKRPNDRDDDVVAVVDDGHDPDAVGMGEMDDDAEVVGVSGSNNASMHDDGGVEDGDKRVRRQRGRKISSRKSSPSKPTSNEVKSHFERMPPKLRSAMMISSRDVRRDLYVLLALIAFRKDIIDFILRHFSFLVPKRRMFEFDWSMENTLKILLAGELFRRRLYPHLRRIVLDGKDRSTMKPTTTVADDDDDIEGSGTIGNENRTRYDTGSSSSLSSTSTTTIARRPSVVSPSVVPTLISVSVIVLLAMFLPRNVAYLVLPMALRALLLLSASGMGGGNDPDNPFSIMMLPMRGWGGGDRMGMARRMAYLPPLEQHYAFEQLNERYFRDWGAYAKAHDVHPMVAPPSSPATGAGPTAGTGGMASLVRSIITGPRQSMSTGRSSSITPPSRREARYPSEYGNGTAIVLDMTRLDAQASKMEVLRDQISFLIHYVAHTTAEADASAHTGDERRRFGDVASDGAVGSAADAATNNLTAASASDVVPTVEVIVLLESPGGGVSQYGLAASQLHRLRSNPNIKLTVCVDIVAASGGYMMACMSSPGQLYCAPFAMIGSIGVIGQSLNIQKTLESYGVRPYVFRGGKMKNPVGMVGEVTRDGVVAMQQMIDRVHDAFRDHVASARGEAFASSSSSNGISRQSNDYFRFKAGDDRGMDAVIDQVATGDVFLGVEALKLGLVDRLITSDEYIYEKIRNGARVLKLINYRRPVGLSGLMSVSPYHHRMHSSLPIVGAGGAARIMKKVVHRLTSALLSWANEGMADCSASSITARAAIDEFQNI